MLGSLFLKTQLLKPESHIKNLEIGFWEKGGGMHNPKSTKENTADKIFP
jgi:hypothetical protein